MTKIAMRIAAVIEMPRNQLADLLNIPEAQQMDADLAELCEVDTMRLNEQVKRNADHLPTDFMRELTPEELPNLKSQFATSSWGGHRKLPSAFTEHGVIMTAGQPI